MRLHSLASDARRYVVKFGRVFFPRVFLITRSILFQVSVAMWAEQNISVGKSLSDLTELAQKNLALNKLLAADSSQLVYHLEPIHLPFNRSIYDEGDRIEFVYFPIDSIISSLAIFEDGTTVEVSMVGKEGLAGISAILGSGATRQWTRLCVGGTLLRLHKKPLDTLFLKNESAMRTLLQVYRSLIGQVSQRAVCNARHSVMERFCCWLLMVHDRVGGTNLNLTQEAIASRLGSRRAGITVAAGALQNMGAIDYQRGHLVISNRSVLEKIACECYSTLKIDTNHVRPLDHGRYS